MKTIDSWPNRADVPPLREGVIHVWRIDLSEPEDRIEFFRSFLNSKEQEQASRFLFPEHRRRFIVGRGQLRTLLGKYVDQEPAKVGFEYTNLGKPSFAPGVSDPHIEFNFTNSYDWAMLAVTLGTELGIDMERIREMSNMEGLARRFFAQPEIDAITAHISHSKRQQGFFRCWTRKEAFLKAIGTGLTFPLDRVCVTVDDRDDMRIEWIDSEDEDAEGWTLRHIEPVEDFVGALARKDHANDVESWHWCE